MPPPPAPTTTERPPLPAPTTTERPIPATKTRPVSTTSISATVSDVLPVTTSTSNWGNATAVLGEQSLEGAYSFIFGLIVFCSILFLLIMAIGFGLYMLTKQKAVLPDKVDNNAIEMNRIAECACKGDETTNDNSSV